MPFAIMMTPAYICIHNSITYMKFNLKRIIPLIIFIISIVPLQAQMLRMVVHTTEQSLAITEMRPDMVISSEVVEAWSCEWVDEQPTFPGGTNALVHFINSSRKYPTEAFNNGIHGRVLCSFIVQPDGEITHINVLKSIEPSLDREAVRVLNSMPKWNAGRVDGTPVPVYCIMPNTFRL